MSKSTTIEDKIVYDLIKERQDKKLLRQTIYQIYRVPFVQFYHKHYGLNVKEGTELLNQSFSVFLIKIEKGMIRPPVEFHLLGLLLLQGREYLQKKSPPIRPQNQLDWAKILSQVNKYCESDILLLLIRRAYPKAFDKIVQAYQDPFISKLKTWFPFAKEEPSEVYGETMAIVQKNISQAKLDIPMTATLYTYCLQVGKRKVLSLLPHKDRKIKLGNYDEATLNQIAEEPLPPSYFEEKWPILQPQLNLEDYSNQGKVVEALLDQIGEPCQSLLRNHYIKGIRIKQIAEDLKMNAATIRKRKHDCMQKIRKLFGIK